MTYGRASTSVLGHIKSHVFLLLHATCYFPIAFFWSNLFYVYFCKKIETPQIFPLIKKSVTYLNN